MKASLSNISVSRGQRLINALFGSAYSAGNLDQFNGVKKINFSDYGTNYTIRSKGGASISYKEASINISEAQFFTDPDYAGPPGAIEPRYKTETTETVYTKNPPTDEEEAEDPDYIASPGTVTYTVTNNYEHQGDATWQVITSVNGTPPANLQFYNSTSTTTYSNKVSWGGFLNGIPQALDYLFQEAEVKSTQLPFSGAVEVADTDGSVAYKLEVLDEGSSLVGIYKAEAFLYDSSVYSNLFNGLPAPGITVSEIGTIESTRKFVQRIKPWDLPNTTPTTNTVGALSTTVYQHPVKREHFSDAASMFGVLNSDAIHYSIPSGQLSSWDIKFVNVSGKVLTLRVTYKFFSQGANELASVSKTFPNLGADVFSEKMTIPQIQLEVGDFGENYGRNSYYHQLTVEADHDDGEGFVRVKPGEVHCFYDVNFAIGYTGYLTDDFSSSTPTGVAPRDSLSLNGAYYDMENTTVDKVWFDPITAGILVTGFTYFSVGFVDSVCSLTFNGGYSLDAAKRGQSLHELGILGNWTASPTAVEYFPATEDTSNVDPRLYWMLGSHDPVLPLFFEKLDADFFGLQ